jgi:hypothetical protein
MRGIVRPDGQVYQPPPEPMGIFCRHCDWNVSVTNPAEVNAVTQQHMETKHPDRFESLQELILSAQVAQDEVGGFLNATFAIIPPASHEKAFRAEVERADMDAENRRVALMSIIEKRLREDAAKAKGATNDNP